MSARIPSDFGIYKENIEPKRNFGTWTYIIVGAVVLNLLLAGTLFVAVATNIQVENIEESENINLPNNPERFVKWQPEIMQTNRHPKPFQVHFQGQFPEMFRVTSTTTEQVVIEDVGSKNYLENIQQNIGNLPEPILTQVRRRKNNVHKKHQIEDIDNENITQGFPKRDPFFKFKPSDPGEVNLMAIANFRFAPPLWKSLTSRDISSQQFPSAVDERAKLFFHIFNLDKPFSLILNIYPGYPNFRQSKYGYRSAKDSWPRMESRSKRSKGEEIIRVDLQVLTDFNRNYNK